jgi:hypothetical protein
MRNNEVMSSSNFMESDKNVTVVIVHFLRGNARIIFDNNEGKILVLLFEKNLVAVAMTS